MHFNRGMQPVTAAGSAQTWMNFSISGSIQHLEGSIKFWLQQSLAVDSYFLELILASPLENVSDELLLNINNFKFASQMLRLR